MTAPGPESTTDRERSDRSYYLAMRDGVRLAVNLYFPDRRTPSAPAHTVLVQTRYGRGEAKLADAAMSIDPWLDAGFVVAVVDVRGTTSSFGPRTHELGPEEHRDMEEIVAHLAEQPWSDGKIVGTGVSYLGNTADMATARHAPAYVGAIPYSTDVDWWELFWPGGIPNDSMFLDWSSGLAHDLDFGRPARVDGELLYPGHAGLDGRARAADCLKLFPVLQPVDEDPDCTLLQQALLTRERDGRHWSPADYDDALFRDDEGANGHSFFTSGSAGHLDAVRREGKPAQFWASWLDGNTAEGALNRYRCAPEVPAEVIITPNDHIGGANADPFLPGSTAPLPSISEQYKRRIAFAEHVSSGRMPERCIHYYVLGAELFRASPTWPPEGVEPVRFALDAGGTLSPGSPATGFDSHQVDFAATTGKQNRWYQMEVPNYGDRRTEDRKLLTYDSAPLLEDTELAGWAVVSLTMKAATEDPAVFAYLEDVAPDGRVTYITEGQLRAVNRRPADPATLPYDPGPAPHSFNRADAMPVVPGEWFSISFKLFACAALLERGHRVRLAIAGADADTFRILSNGRPERFDIARGGSEPSAVELPLRRFLS